MAVSTSQPRRVEHSPLLAHRNGCGHPKEVCQAPSSAQNEGERAGAEGDTKRTPGAQISLVFGLRSHQACGYPGLLAIYWSFHSSFVCKGEE